MKYFYFSMHMETILKRNAACPSKCSLNSVPCLERTRVWHITCRLNPVSSPFSCIYPDITSEGAGGGRRCCYSTCDGLYADAADDTLSAKNSNGLQKIQNCNLKIILKTDWQRSTSEIHQPTNMMYTWDRVHITTQWYNVHASSIHEQIHVHKM